MNYVTTNIRIPEDDYLRLKEEAARKRKSLAAVIREKVGIKKEKLSREEYLKVLLTPTDWFTEEDYRAYLENRKKLKERRRKYNF